MTKRRPTRLYCPLCQRPYRTQGALQEHIRRHHTAHMGRLRDQFTATSKEEGMEVIKK